ncbi:MAG: biosynthetic-type acetolactate synthase large subunit [Rikenellaceae bacterium]
MAIHKNISGAEAILISLMEEGVDTLFGYPGGAIIPIYDKLYDYKDKLRHILTRHEQGAVHSAQGFARATGKVGVCMATSGPGATNLITGIADAMIDSTPLVCITAQVGSGLLGSDAFQEGDTVSMTMPISKWNCQITRVEEIPEAVAKAFFIAQNGRPGPVVIDITKDAQASLLERFEYKKCTSLRSYNPRPAIDQTLIDSAVELINNASKPLFIVGQGVKLSGAEQSVIDLCEKAYIPMASTLMGLSAIPSSHPLFVGKLGMHGNIAANEMTQNCDLLIAVGMRFSDRVTGDLAQYAPLAKIIHVDIDAVELNKIVKSDISIEADAKDAVEAMYAKVNTAERAEWLAFGKEQYNKEYEECIDPIIHPTTDELTMGEVVDMVAEKYKGDAIIVTDVGQQQMFASRYSKFNTTRTFITSGGFGTMGFGLPAAIGAKIGCPDKEVILFAGDGGIQMTMQELGTILQENISVKIVVLNNSFLGMVRQWQQLFFDSRYSFTEMVNPRFDKIAAAYDIDNSKVDTREQLKVAIEEMAECKGAYLMEVSVINELNVFPMVPAGASISNLILKE